MKILVIEDEHRIAHYIKKGLELQSHRVDVAYDGETGYDLAANEPYDVIILDRMLPQLDGLSICKQLRQQNLHTPILMLTAKSQVGDRVEGLEAGADDYLIKPFAFSELVARIKALARRPQQTIDAVLSFDNLELNTNTFEVKRNGTIITLSRTEFALLEFLLRHPNQIISKDQLTQQVWTYDSDVLANTAQVYIGYLRKKVDRAFPQEKNLIHTIRGFGYKLGDSQ